MSKKAEPATNPPTTQTCPDCEGLMPAEAVQIGEWTYDASDYVPRYRRVISMHCPHCGSRHHRTETQRASCFIV